MSAEDKLKEGKRDDLEDNSSSSIKENVVQQGTEETSQTNVSPAVDATTTVTAADSGATQGQNSADYPAQNHDVAALYDKNPITDDDVPLTFPQRLMEILSDESNSSFISWLPHGKGWIILNKKAFAAEILPKYFSRKSKFTSFTRKLNRWNFTRVTRGPEANAYYHPLFQRDNPDLILQMSCIDSKTPQRVQPLNPIALGLGPAVPPLGSDLSVHPALLVQLQQHETQQLHPSEQSVGPVAETSTITTTSQPAIFSAQATSTPTGGGPNASTNPVDLNLQAAVQVPTPVDYQAAYYAMALVQQHGSMPSLMPPVVAPITHYEQIPLALPPKPKKSTKRLSHPQGDSDPASSEVSGTTTAAASVSAAAPVALAQLPGAELTATSQNPTPVIEMGTDDKNVEVGGESSTSLGV